MKEWKIYAELRLSADYFKEIEATEPADTGKIVHCKSYMHTKAWFYHWCPRMP